MFTTEIEWHETAVELPEASGNYLAITVSGSVRTLPYSSKNKAFNAHDYDSSREVKEYEIECKYWAQIPDMPETESEGE